MAKKKQESALEAEMKMSIGSMMKTRLTQRERNLAVKAELVKAGKHPEPKHASGLSQKGINLLNKAKLKGDGGQE
jgi:hypothetical protein